MSERGVFEVDHGIFTDDRFFDPKNPVPYSEREAWMWLLAEAAWRPRKVRVGTDLIGIERGQLCHSLRFMAAA